MKPQPTHFKYRLENLRLQAPNRPPGHLEDYVAHATRTSGDGQFIYIPADDAHALSEKYAAHWMPEVAKKTRTKKGPPWWRIYQGRKSLEELQELAMNVFDLEAVLEMPLLQPCRDQLIERLAVEGEGCSPCRMRKIVADVTFAIVNLLNQHEPLD